ncbi:MAG: riboflavin biosynthesis protein RibF [Candidatus Brocadiia bacterium]
MHTVRGLYAPLPPLAAPVVALGAFDGVHRGHQRILGTARTWAAEMGGESVALTFATLPRAVVGRGGALCITSLPHRLVLLERCGIDVAVVLPFDERVASIPAEGFVRDVLLGWLGARRIVLGRDATFGRGARGDLAVLRRLEARGVLEVRSPPPVYHDGEVVSSSAIREAIAEGDLDQAAALLGRPYSLLGTVEPGAGRGRSLGFPTANLDLHHEAFPPDGVYATVAYVDGRSHPSLTYIGRRPTFEPDASPIVEVHVIGLQAELYGRELEVEFIQRLRGDARFHSPQALVEQMRADRQAALAAYAAARDGCGPTPH